MIFYCIEIYLFLFLYNFFLQSQLAHEKNRVNIKLRIIFDKFYYEISQFRAFIFLYKMTRIFNCNMILTLCSRDYFLPKFIPPLWLQDQYRKRQLKMVFSILYTARLPFYSRHAQDYQD